LSTCLSYEADVGGDEEGEADGQAEGDGGAQHVQVTRKQAAPTLRTEPTGQLARLSCGIHNLLPLYKKKTFLTGCYVNLKECAV
jgi:hypothetical protein